MKRETLPLSTPNEKSERTLEIRVGSPTEFSEETAEAFAEDQGGDSLWFESPEKVLRLFSEARYQLLNTIGSEQPESKNELVELTGRDSKSVYRDMNMLEEYGIVGIKQEGQRKRPVLLYDEIEIEIDLTFD
ncbi:hypothetical protein [Haloarcula amylolytica]|uniref:HVO_A0114 family putative DNA-binding protein n=1 Tax=Haloarcula amylolytica TaxID=396317 RepID=UPI003C72D4BC